MIEKSISTIEELVDALNGFRNHYIYRGQSSAGWDLTSSLERVIGKEWTAENVAKYEDYSYQKFESKFHLYDTENFVPDSKLAWLAAMQHYGIPTRLIDFTTSPYVALYFAMETYDPRSHGDFAIYALDYTEIMERSLKTISDSDAQFNETRHSLHPKQDEIYASVIERYTHKIAWVTEPRIVNKRLDRQEGTFLVSVDRSTKIAEVLSSERYAGTDLVKLIVNRELHSGVFALLRKMNLTSKSLYGDLAGLAQSIRMEMMIYR